MTKLKELDTSLISTGALVEGGCCWISFKESPRMPTSAVEKMRDFPDFESLGELSKDGIVASLDEETPEFEGGHATIVLTGTPKKKRTYKISFLETTRAAVAKLEYGSQNVTEVDGIVTSVCDKVKTPDKISLIFDHILSDGRLQRVILPRASIIEHDDVTYKPDELISYGMTFMPLECSEGYSFQLFTAKPRVTGETPQSSNIPAAA